ncbi:YkgJ family cysteine cluster protein, partial [Moraxella lacunata]
MSDLRPNFWQNYPLSALTDNEWEALCDGCGVCCLVKYLDDDNPRFTEYTDVACKLLDTATGHCSDYANRKASVPDCIRLTVDMLPNMMWLPRHCAYKRLHLGQGLPHWHYLKTGQD